METTVMRERAVPVRNFFPWISWGAIIGGLASGMATYILFALFGLASGLTSTKGARASDLMVIVSGFWTSFSFAISAFMGGYVSARMCGLSRLADGILHGLVAWGMSTLIFTFLLTTSFGSLVGGNFALVGQGGKIIAGKGAAAEAGAARQQWGLFLGILFSLGLGMFGGALGSKASVRRRMPRGGEKAS